MKNLAIDVLKKKWRAENCSYTPASASEIHDFERERKIVFPEDFKRYLLEVNGTKVDGDSNLFEFYPLDRLETWIEKKWTIPPRAPNYFVANEFYVFCDYMISCWAYAIRLGNDQDSGEVLACGWLEFTKIADSFTDFIELYLADDERIYPPPQPVKVST